MKVEIGESLILSWLRHIKECQIVQTNWKASAKWELKSIETLELLKQRSDELFKDKYGYDIYKGSSSLAQILMQAEVDVLGVSYENGQSKIYAVDVAFHEAGLNYGLRDETVARVVKKCLRTAMCVYGYFGLTTGVIIFASPKINPSVCGDLQKCLPDIVAVLDDVGMGLDVRIIGNEDFSGKILEPVLSVLGDVADTSELFMRSLQLYNLFANKKAKSGTRQNSTVHRIDKQLNAIESGSIQGLDEMKIGVIVRTVLRKILESGKINADEIVLLQTKEYSKNTFDIQYPVLIKANEANDKSPVRYYSTPVRISGVDYFLCSEWFEVPANNDRPYLLKWLALHTD